MKIKIQMFSDDALSYLRKNIDRVTETIEKNEGNEWIYDEFPKPIFIVKKFEINDFNLIDNPESKDKEIDLKNSLTIYFTLKELPRYILTDERFWLWLEFGKFYKETRNMMKIESKTTVKNHWLFGPGVRRGLMFGVLSRLYFRVALTIDEKAEDPFYLTRWIIDSPSRFREFSWRTYSSEEHLVRGIIKGEKRAIEELEFEKTIYDELAKEISMVGGVKLLDSISEEDIEEIAYYKTKELLKRED